jgi:hypothetical protein
MLKDQLQLTGILPGTQIQLSQWTLTRKGKGTKRHLKAICPFDEHICQNEAAAGA